MHCKGYSCKNNWNVVNHNIQEKLRYHSDGTELFVLKGVVVDLGVVVGKSEVVVEKGFLEIKKCVI